MNDKNWASAKCESALSKSVMIEIQTGEFPSQTEFFNKSLIEQHGPFTDGNNLAFYELRPSRLPPLPEVRVKPESLSNCESKQDRERDMPPVKEVAKRLIENVEKVIVGKRPQLVHAIVCWLCEGHILLEDVPGVAKTMLARAMAKSVGCEFKRVQCTPDLLPSDVTGASIFDPKESEFEFRPGPLFANLVLADEINRATPRTQAAMLEAMAEACVTVDGVTHKLNPPFIVMATQNPVDHEGTFPLPEAQLDRFLMKLSLGYPSMEDELKMLEMLQLAHPVDSIGSVVSQQEIIDCQQEVRKVFVDPKIRQYLLQIVHDTRESQELALGGSPRASIALFRTSQAMAAVRGRNFVQPDDVKKIVGPVLNHRVILKPESRLRKISADHIIKEIVAEIAVPVLSNATAKK